MKKVMISLLTLVVLIINLTGCQMIKGEEDYISKEPTLYEVLTPTEAGKALDLSDSAFINEYINKRLTEDQYTVTYLDEDHPEVLKVKALMDEWLMASYDTNNYEGEKELGLMTDDMFRKYQNNGYTVQKLEEEAAADTLRTYKGIKSISIFILNDSFTKCTTDFILLGDYENKNWENEMALMFTKEKDIWKVNAQKIWSINEVK